MPRIPQEDASDRNSPESLIGDNSVANADANTEADVWAEAPDAPLIPFITDEQRANLISTRATLYLTGMEYVKDGRFGPKFEATFIAPDGNGYSYSMTTAHGRTPRDKINKWLWDLITNQKRIRIPVQLVKRGSAYMLDKPGSETDPVATVAPVSSMGDKLDTPDF